MSKHGFPRGWRLIGVTLLLICPACKRGDFEQIPESKLDISRKTSAETLGTRILKEWAKDQYKEVAESEASAEFRKAHNDPAAQRTADKQIEQTLGSFSSMTFHEALRSKDQQFDVYRFKATFDKTPDRQEVRVVLDQQGKLSGFWIKPWKDQLSARETIASPDHRRA